MKRIELKQVARCLALDRHPRRRSSAARQPSVRHHPAPWSLLCHFLAELEERDRESEVLEKINVRDGDAFRAGKSPSSNPPMPKIDGEARRRALAMKRTVNTHFAPRIAPAKNLESMAPIGSESFAHDRMRSDQDLAITKIGKRLPIINDQ